MTSGGGRRPSRTLVGLILLGVANHTVLAGSRVVVSLDALGRGASPFVVGVLMALYAFLPMLLAVAAGRYSDRKGVRRPMTLGCVAIVVGAALPFALAGLAPLFASATLVGAGFMAFQVAAQNATGELGGPPERARNFSLLALGYSVSGFVGPLVAGFTIDHAGFGAAFGVLALVSLAPLTVLLAGRLALPGPHPATTAAHHGGVLALLRHRTLGRVFAINAMLAIGWDLHTIFVPIYGAKIGLSASAIGGVLSAFAAATFVVRLAMPAIARRATEHQVLTGALFVAGAVYLVFPFAQSMVLLLPLSFCLGLGLGSGQPMVMALLHTHAPPGRMGEAAGVRMSLVQSMAVAVPLVFGALGTTVGLAPVFWSVGAVLAAGGFLSRRRGA
ncbi:MAG: MFS transporter [Betaproteobacteria bacterium]